MRWPTYADVPILERVGRAGAGIWTVHPGYRRTRTAEYFVDEAGDPLLFNARKQVIVGTEGCSKYFMLGMLWALDAERLGADLEALRREILADPYFTGVPSLLPASRKTATIFHAKNDLAEVRREVFRVLMKHPLQFFAVIYDKLTAVDRVRARNAREPGYRYHQHEMYDSMVERLLTGRLHRDRAYVVHFARRGRSDRTEALRLAVQAARLRSDGKMRISSDSPIDARAVSPLDSTCLQACDYMLWALQRLYEKGEERFLAAVWPAVRLVHDVDDVSEAAYGRYYTQTERLDGGALRGRRRRI